MKQKEAKDFIPLIKAWSEGKTLQFRAAVGGNWEDVCDVTFCLPADLYRIKPEPVVREMYINRQADISSAYLYNNVGAHENPEYKKVKVTIEEIV